MAFLSVASKSIFVTVSAAALISACGSRSSDEANLLGGGGFDGSVAGASFAGTSAHGGSAVASGGSSSTGGGTMSSSGGTIAFGGDGSASGGSPNGGEAGEAAGAPAGGVSSGGASNAGATSGGSSSGGSSAAGGATGGSVGVAGGGGGFVCPSTAPVPTGNRSLACSNQNEVCSYTGERCTCQRQARSNTLAWACVGSGDACPRSEPADNSTCPTNLNCPYPNGEQCNCRQGQWNCFTPGCPTTKPMPGGNCGAVGGQCRYGTAGACVCVGGGWFCN